MSDVSPEQLKARAWARVYAAVQPPYSKNLRHGTWYPVVRDDIADRVSLRVGTQIVDVPRTLLEIRDQRPPHFTIVDRLGARPDPADKLGKRYVVCPACSKRSELMGRPDQTKCKECGYEADIGWWE
jgi:hypothetical protein